MLGKLLKYETKATARWFLPLYAALIILAVINRFFFSLQAEDNQFVSFKNIGIGLSMLLYVVLFIGIMVITLVVVIQRFYKSLLGDEGYLMFTLPLATWKHVINKLLVGMLWYFLSMLVAFGSILILIPADDLRQFPDLFNMIREYFGPAGFFILPLLCLIVLATSVIEMYTAIALGHLFNKHKLLASFGMYLGLSTVSQFIYLLVSPYLMKITLTSAKFDILPTQADLITICLILIGISSVIGVGYFYVTNLLLKKKLNLE